jgi:hypothetical protein
MKKKNPAALGQPHLAPNTDEKERLNTPNDVENKIDWQKKMGDGDRSRKLRGNDAKRLKGGEKGV